MGIVLGVHNQEINVKYNYYVDFITDYTANSTLRNNHVCINFWISFNRNRITFAATRHVPWAVNTPRIRNAFLVK